MLSQKLHAEVAKAAREHYQLEPHEVELGLTRDLGHGDFTTNIALKVASKWGVPPREAAATMLKALQASAWVAKTFTRIEVAGPGFINFTAHDSVWFKSLGELGKPGARRVLRGKKIIVEYSSPNIAKPMHIGHIRSTIIGEAVANLYESLGAKVTRINHLGDWGTQFGKLIAAYKLWGTRTAVHRQPIEEMLRLYVKFHEEIKTHPDLEHEGQEEFRKLEAGDKKNRALWTWFKRESLREFNVLYKRLGVQFTYVTGESYYEPQLKGVVADLLRRKIAVKNSDGSVVVHLTSEGLAPCLVQKSDGASLYATRDLAAIRYRVQRFRPQSVLYVVANQQALHFEQVFAVAKLAGYSGHARLEHLKFGLVLGEDGLKMATREGKIVKLEEVLAEAVTRARSIIDKKNSKLAPKLKAKVAEVVGVGAVKYNDLSQNRHTDITFNWDRMLSLDGNSGPYLQYTYVRLKSILRKSSGGKSAKRLPHLPADASKAATPADRTMLRTLTRFPEQVLRAADEHGPHLLATYLFELANGVNSFYESSPVLQASAPLKALRLHLVSAAADVLHDGLAILGIDVVEQM